MHFLPWSRFLIIVSSPACIGNRNHFRTHRDQILIGSLVNSKQVNGRALQKETFTARLLLYVYVGYPRPHPIPPKRRICINLRNGLWQKWRSTPWRRPCPCPPTGKRLKSQDLDLVIATRRLQISPLVLYTSDVTL